MLWANMHEAFATGIIITAVYCFSKWVKYFSSKENLKEVKKYSAVLICSIAVVIINPNGFSLLLQPLNIFSQVYENKYTTELLSFTSNAYWQKEAWIFIILACLIFIKIIFEIVSKKRSIIYDLPDIILLSLFFYLGLTAYRNIVFFFIISFPYVAELFKRLMKRVLVSAKIVSVASKAFLLLAVLFYILIVSDRYYKLIDSRDRFGLEILATHNPTGAGKYITGNNLQKEKCFSDYLSSSYFLYRFYPDFKSYI
jgi:hypothetical protein